MSLDYVRQLVSGKKARFVDSENAVNLDLVYVTDRIIIMGYPAVGVSALYWNRRRDVLKFINARHGEKWWIWNLCPLYENAYSPDSMHNRVSRYPFPDHHPPPLPLLPLAVREMTAWLAGDQDRVAIIHCKAGKGRSGTLLCSYMLSLPSLPPPPQLDQNYTQKEQIRRLQERVSDAEQKDREPRNGWLVIGGGEEYEEVEVGSQDGHERNVLDDALRTGETTQPYSTVPRSTNSSTTTLSRPSPPPSVDIRVESTPAFNPIDVGDEGSLDDAGQGDRTNGKVDSVFKLHSSRRMKPTSSGRGVSIPSQRRWCRYMNLLFSNQAPKSYLHPGSSRIMVKSVTILLHPPSGWHKPVASLLLGSHGAGMGKAWASVGRYDDEYVATLRHRGGAGEGAVPEVTWGGVGGEGGFDTEKMFRSCGKMTSEGDAKASSIAMPEDHEYNVHHLIPRSSDGSKSLILDCDREFRLKLHLSSLPLGWLWLIPAFHLPEQESAQAPTSRVHTLTFSRSQLDFAIGPGTAVHKVMIQLEEVYEHDERSTARLLTSEEEVKAGFADHEGEQVREDGERE